MAIAGAIVDAVRLAKARGVPIIGITTPDQFDTRSQIGKAVEALKAHLADAHVLDWDIADGVTVFHKNGAQNPSFMSDLPMVQIARDPQKMLITLAPKLGKGDVLVMRGAHAVLGNAVCAQAIANLRDQYKANNRTLVLLGPTLRLPPELANDVLLEDQPLPVRSEIGEVVDKVAKDQSVEFEDGERDRVVDAVQGLTVFGAEQVLSLGLVIAKAKPRFDLGRLWERKKAFIRQTPGLSISDEHHTYDDIGGLEWLKSYFRRLIKGKRPPKVVCFIDEIEKALAGFSGDNTGVTQDQMQALLTHMQNRKALGALFIGAPGACKTYFATATGNEAGVPTVIMDFGGMKSAHVGSSEYAIRHGLKLLDAVADNDQLFLGSCNSLGQLPPELLRRFRIGVIFFDLPDEKEKSAIWSVKLKQYQMAPVGADLPSTEGWTGAQIEHCVDSAWRFGIPLKEAAEDIVPYAVTSARQLEELRQQAAAQGLKVASTGRRFEHVVVTTGGRATLPADLD